MVSNAAGAQLARDGNGTFVAVFDDFHGSNVSIYSSRYTAGAWGTATFIGNGPELEEAPQVAADINGNAMAIWMQGFYPLTIYANDYIARQL